MVDLRTTDVVETIKRNGRSLLVAQGGRHAIVDALTARHCKGALADTRSSWVGYHRPRVLPDFFERQKTNQGRFRP